MYIILSDGQIIAYAGWSGRKKYRVKKRLRRFIKRQVFKRLGAHGSRVGRLQIVIEYVAECLVSVSNRDVAVAVLSAVMEKTKDGSEVEDMSL